MADVKIRFAVNPDAETEKLGDIYVDNVDKASNTSFVVDDEGKYQEQPTSAINGVEGLSWGKGYLVFNADGYLANEDTQNGVLTSEQEPQEFVWGATDNGGYYEVKVSFRNAANLDAVVFYGDTVANQFPTMAFLDNSTDPIYSDDARWAIKFNEPSAEHSIRFVQWHRPNYNAVLTKIAVMPAYVEIDKYSGLKSVESLSQISNNANEINYDVLPSSGRVTFIDVGGEIKDYIDDGIIKSSDLSVEIYANGKEVNSHISTNSDYNINTKEVTFELEDKLSKLDTYQYTGYKYNGQGKTLYDILIHVLEQYGYSDEEILYSCSNNIIYENLEITIKEYLEKIKISYPYLKKSTFREALNKICSVGQLIFSLNDEGKIEFYSARPVETFEKMQSPIVIPQKMQSLPPACAVVLNNKFDKVDIEETLMSNDKEQSLGDRAITFFINEGTDGPFTDKTDEIPAEYEASKTVWTLSTGTTKTSIVLHYKINSDVVYLKNAKLKYNVTWYYSAGSGETYSDNWEIALPPEGGTAGSLSHSGAIYLNKPLIIVDKVDTQGNIELTMQSWLKGDILGNGYSIVVLNSSLSIVADTTTASNTTVSFGDGNNGVQFKQNELMQTTTKLDDKKLSSVVASNIFNDYKNGLTFGSTEVCCLDYYNMNGEKVIDWSKGEMLKKGDIIRIDKDNNGNPAFRYANGKPIIGRIISRNFEHIGKPTLQIDWIEVKPNDE